MLKIKNLRRLFAIIGTGISIVSFSGCVKQNNKVNENSKEEISVENITEDSNNDVLEKFENEEYWWPIGSIDTYEYKNKLYASYEPEESIIVKKFISGNDILSSKTIKESHSGVDIVTSSESGLTNIVAAKSGIVVYPTEQDRIDFKENEKAATSYGNYVIIEHVDGNFTLYAHLKENTIKVKAGDVVNQGEVIGKMGNSGNSIGPHMHFEIRIEGNTLSRTVNPEAYVKKENPRLTNGKKDYESDEISYYSEEEILKQAKLILNKQNNWELKLDDITLRVITSESIIDLLNSKSEQLNVNYFTIQDLEAYGIKEAVLNDTDKEYVKMH